MLLKNYPTSKKVLYLLAELHETTGDESKAEEVYEMMVEK